MGQRQRSTFNDQSRETERAHRNPSRDRRAAAGLEPGCRASRYEKAETPVTACVTAEADRTQLASRKRGLATFTRYAAAIIDYELLCAARTLCEDPSVRPSRSAPGPLRQTTPIRHELASHITTSQTLRPALLLRPVRISPCTGGGRGVCVRRLTTLLSVSCARSMLRWWH